MARPLGTPTWLNLGSTDIAASQAFYEKLLGWTFVPAGEAMPGLSTITLGDDPVGVAMDVSGMTCPEGGEISSGWDVYLAVDDLDNTLRAATERGARVYLEAGEAGPSGRFAGILDPTGAAVGLWQAGEVEGFTITGRPGSPIWFELLTQDFEGACAFYRDVLDFDLVPMETPMEEGAEIDATRYSTNGRGDDATSGICDVRGFVPAEEGSWWRFYVVVENCDDAVVRVRELGGALVDDPIDSPFGRIATVADPAGATFQLCAPSQAETTPPPA